MQKVDLNNTSKILNKLDNKFNKILSVNSVLDSIHHLLLLIKFRLSQEEQEKIHMLGSQMDLGNSKLLKQKIVLKEEVKLFFISEKIIKTLLIQLILSKSLINILTLLTSQFQLTDKVLIWSKLYGLEIENKLLMNNIKNSINLYTVQIIINIKFISNLMCHWLLNQLFIFLNIIVKSLDFNNKKVKSVFILKKYWLKKIVNKHFSLHF